MTKDKDVKIIKVEKKKNSKKYKVETLTDTYTFSEDMLIKYHIFKESTFTSKEFENILKDSILDEYFNLVLNYLSYSNRSEYEIRQYLKSKILKTKKIINEEEVDRIIDRINSLGYLDEQNLSNQIMSHYLSNFKGPKYIEKKLQEKHISPIVIKSTLENYSIDMQEENINYIISKNSSSSKYPINKQKSLLTDKLLRDGYYSNLVYKAVNDYKYIDKSEDLLKRDYEKLIFKLSKKEMSSYDKKQYITSSLLNKGYEYKKIQELFKH